MDNTSILIITFGSVISSCLLCICFRYFKKRQEEINEKNNVNKIVVNLKKKNIIIPLEIVSEEVKDEMENELRNTEPVNSEENV